MQNNNQVKPDIKSGLYVKLHFIHKNEIRLKKGKTNLEISLFSGILATEREKQYHKLC